MLTINYLTYIVRKGKERMGLYNLKDAGSSPTLTRSGMRIKWKMRNKTKIMLIM